MGRPLTAIVETRAQKRVVPGFPDKVPQVVCNKRIDPVPNPRRCLRLDGAHAPRFLARCDEAVGCAIIDVAKRGHSSICSARWVRTMTRVPFDDRHPGPKLEFDRKTKLAAEPDAAQAVPDHRRSGVEAALPATRTLRSRRLWARRARWRTVSSRSRAWSPA